MHSVHVYSILGDVPGRDVLKTPGGCLILDRGFDAVLE